MYLTKPLRIAPFVLSISLEAIYEHSLVSRAYAQSSKRDAGSIAKD
jgi:hypothetical protein